MKQTKLLTLFFLLFWGTLSATGCKVDTDEIPDQNTDVPNQSEDQETNQEENFQDDLIFVQGGVIQGKANTNNFPGVFIEGRTVTLSSFYICDHEVTQQEYEEVMSGKSIKWGERTYQFNPTPSSFRLSDAFHSPQKKLRPVERVSWFDAVYYCNMLSERKKLVPAYEITIKAMWTSGQIANADVRLIPGANGYRLPTEAEWEYAARGGDPSAPAWDDLFSGAPSAEGVTYDIRQNSGMDSVGWYAFNNKTGVTTADWQSKTEDGQGTHQVKMRQPNRLGLYDMSGNVSEWCWDYYDTISAETVTDPTGPENKPASVDPNFMDSRVIRGGSWILLSDNSVSVCYRDTVAQPNLTTDNIGFRVVRSAINE